MLATTAAAAASKNKVDSGEEGWLVGCCLAAPLLGLPVKSEAAVRVGEDEVIFLFFSLSPGPSIPKELRTRIELVVRSGYCSRLSLVG